MSQYERDRIILATAGALSGAVALWFFARFLVSVGCFFWYGKDAIPPVLDFIAHAVPWLAAIVGGIGVGWIAHRVSRDERHSDYI
jgi:hypothetical protein